MQTYVCASTAYKSRLLMFSRSSCARAPRLRNNLDNYTFLRRQECLRRVLQLVPATLVRTNLAIMFGMLGPYGIGEARRHLFAIDDEPRACLSGWRRTHHVRQWATHVLLLLRVAVEPRLIESYRFVCSILFACCKVCLTIVKIRGMVYALTIRVVK